MSKKSTQKTESSPPSWALPGLETVGKEALALHNAGKGFNVYEGPTQTDYSDTSLGAMNGILAATGAGGPGTKPITNQTVKDLIPTDALMKLINEAKTRNKAAPAPVAAAAPVQQFVQPSTFLPSSGNEGGRGQDIRYMKQMRQRAQGKKSGPLW